MARSNESYRLGYGASNYTPDSGSSVSFGRVGTPVQSLAAPGRSAGAGVGATLSLPVGRNVKKRAKGGSVSSASKRADGCATKGKTKGRMV